MHSNESYSAEPRPCTETQKYPRRRIADGILRRRYPRAREFQRSVTPLTTILHTLSMQQLARTYRQNLVASVDTNIELCVFAVPGLAYILQSPVAPRPPPPFEMPSACVALSQFFVPNFVLVWRQQKTRPNGDDKKSGIKRPTRVSIFTRNKLR